METALDDHFIHVVPCDRDRLEGIIGNVMKPVADRLLRVQVQSRIGYILALRQCHGKLGGGLGFLVHRLVDGHRLCPFHDPLAGGQFRILGHYRDLSRKLMLCQRADRLARQVIIAAHDTVDGPAVQFKAFISRLKGKLRQPVVAEGRIDDLHTSPLKGFFKAFSDHAYVVVAGRSLDLEDPSAFRKCLRQRLSHQGADSCIVK